MLDLVSRRRAEVDPVETAAGSDAAVRSLTAAGTRFIWRLTMSVMLGIVLVVALASMALAASPGCTEVNSGRLNYTGPSPTAQLGFFLAQFYPGDQLFMTYTSSSPKAGVVLDLILTSVSVNTVITGATGTTQSLSATVGVVLPIGAKAGITDATALLNSRSVVLTVTCSAAPAPTTLVLSSTPNPSVFGQTANLSASITSPGGTPNGNVIFTIDGVAQSAVALSSGVATISTSTLSAGNHVVSASYAGNTNFTAASSTLSGGQTVSKANTSTTLGSSAASSAFGTNVVFTATTSVTVPGGGTPDGSMIFTIDGVDQPTVSLSGGSATLSTSSLSVGSHVVSARYAGSDSYNTSNGGLSGGQSVVKAATDTSVTQSAVTTIFGQSTTFRATVSSAAGTPAGSVVFTLDSVAQAPIALSGGIAELTTSALTVGSHTVSASYGGTASLLASSGSLTGGHLVNVIPTATALTGPGPVVFGNAATIIASVTATSGIPAGSIVFTVDGVARAPVALDNNGSASVMLTGLAAGTHSVSASYAGATTYGASSGTLSGGQVVSRGTTTTSISAIAPVTLGQSVSLVATVASTSGTPDGTVVFTIGGVASAPVTLINGQANLLVPGLAVGSHVVSAVYSGADNFTASSGTASATVNKAASSLVVNSSANPSVRGQGITVTATANSAVGTPTGQLTFTVDGVDQVAVALVGGAATLSLPGLSVGNHIISATYQGNADLLASSASLPGGQTVARAATTISLQSDVPTSAFAATVTFTADVAPVAPGAGTPTGDVIFSIDGVAQQPAALNVGVASLTRANLGVGVHTVTAIYAGNLDFGPASASLGGGQTVTTAATTTSLGFTPANPRFGDTAMLTASVSASNGVPTGSIIFTINGTDQTPTSMVNGVAQLTLPNLAVSTYTLGARFDGSTSYLASAATDATMVVAKALTTTSVSAAPASVRLGESTTISATVSVAHGTPSGSVEFRADGALLGTVVLNTGAASLATSALLRGDHAITVTYLGSTDHAASMGTLATPVTVTAGTTTLSLSANPQPSTYGQTVTLTATATAIAGTPSGTVVFTVDGVARPAATLAGGVASLTVSALEPGVHTVTASYGGSSDHVAASASIVGGVVVGKASATLGLVANPATPAFGDSVTITATLASGAGTPTGDVVFIVDGVARPAQTPTAGVASIVLSALAAGAHTIEASFAGDARFAPVSSVLSGGVTVTAASTTMTLGASPDPARFGDPAAFTATLSASSGTATGSVVFTIDGVAQAPVSLVGGVAVLTTSALTVGPHVVSAAYAAQGNFGASSATLANGIDIDVAATQTGLSGPVGTIVVGGTARFVATVTAAHGTPTGAIVFTIDGVDRLPVTLSNRAAALDVVFDAAGTHTIVATYTGAANFAPSNVSLSGGIAIGKAATQTALALATSSPFGAPLTVTATVSSTAGSPGGSVTFSVDGNAVGSAIVVNGMASLVLPQLAVGTNAVTAEYSGDLNFASSSAAAATVNIVQAAVTTTISASAPAVTQGEPVTITARVISANGPATGSVTITIGTTDHFIALINGVATLTVADLVAGTYPISVAYAATTNFAAGSAALVPDMIVNTPPTDINVSANLPRSVAGTAYAGSFGAYGGVAPYSFAVTVGALPPGLSLIAATGVLTGTPTTPGTYNWEITATGAAGAPGVYQATLIVFTPATITLPAVPTTSVYGVAFSASLAAIGGTAPMVYAVTAGALPPGLLLNAATGEIAGSPTQLGAASFTISATDTNAFVGSRSYTLTVTAPTILVAGSFSTATVGAPFSTTVTASGGTMSYTYALDGTLPAGLALDRLTGIVSGTPTTAGQYSFAILATDANGFGGRLDAVLDIAAQPAIVLPTTLAVPRQNRPYSQALTATGGTGPYGYIIANGALPAGIALNPNTGRLSGTPTGSGSSTFTVQATDTLGLAGAHEYTLNVQAAAVLVVDASLDPVVAGVAYADAITVSGGTGPYTITIVSGSLPLGLSLDATGNLTGTTWLPGSYGLVLEIIDAGGDSVTASVTVQVRAPVISVIVTLVNANFGASVSGSVVGSGGTGPYSYAVASGALPTGVTLNTTTGVLSGTAAPAGIFNAVITATDSKTFGGTAAVSMVITAPTLVLSSLPAQFMLGRSVNETVSVNGGRGPYRFVVSGNLPSGLTLDPDSGILSGTPNAIGQRSFSITATDADLFTTIANYTIEIVTNIGNAVLPASLPPVTAGASYVASVAATGGATPLTYAISGGALPQGLDLDTATGAITGTTLATGTVPIEVTVTGTDGRINSASYSVVSTAPVFVATGPLNAGLAGTIYSGALDVSGGTAPYGYVLKSGALPAGLTLGAGGGITGAPTGAGSFPFVVAVTDSNGFTQDLTFNLGVAAPAITLLTTTPAVRIGQSYTGSVTATGGAAPLRFTVTSGTLPDGISLNVSGALSGTPLSAGSSTVTITATDANGFAGAGTYDLVIATNVGTAAMPGTLPTPVIGQAYTESVGAMGGSSPYSYAVTLGSLPPGLSLDIATGIISGTPTTAGNFSFGITVTDAAGLINPQSYAFTIVAPTISISASPPNGVVGQLYSTQATVTGGSAPYVYAIEDAPPGLGIAQNGLISGTPTTAGPYNFNVVVTDLYGFHLAQRFAMVVAATPVALTLPSTLPNATEGTSYAASLVPGNAVGTVTYSLANGSTLPAGLLLDGATGTISGTPTTAGSYGFDIHAVDANGNIGDASYTLMVAANQPPQAAATTTMLAATASSVKVGESATLMVTVTSSGGPVNEGMASVIDVGTGSTIGSGVLAANGTFSFTVAFNTAVDRTLIAQYAGTPRFVLSSTASTTTIAVTPAVTSVVLSGTSGSVTAGTPVVVVANAIRQAPATGAAGIGDMVFSVDGVDQKTQTVTGGSSSFTTSLPPGEYRVGARFVSSNGDDQNSSDERLIVVTSATTTSLAAPTGDIAPGQSVTYTATVTPVELGVPLSGNVIFRDNSQALATVALVNSVAQLSVTTATPGVHAITAEYLGDRFYLASTLPAASHTVVVPPGAPVLSTTVILASSTMPQIGEPLVLTATVVANGIIIPTGSVTFINDTTQVTLATATLNSAGVATITLALTDGTSATISAHYSGDARALASSDTVTVNPILAATQITLSAATASVLPGAPVTLIAEVRRQAGGMAYAATIAFLANGIAFAHVPTNGGATVSTASDPIVVATVFTAQFIPGPSGADGASISGPVTVNGVRATPVVTVSVTIAGDGSALGTVSVTPPAGVVQPPGGLVALSASAVAGKILTLVNGAADFDYPVGSFVNTGASFTADYVGDTLFMPASGSRIVVSSGGIATTMLVEVSDTTVLLNQPVIVTIRVSASFAVNGGLVDIYQNGRRIVTVQESNGIAMLALTGLTVGQNNVTARYLGTAQHAPSDGNVISITVLGAPAGGLTVSLVADSPALFSIGQAVTITATVVSNGAAANNIAVNSMIGFNCPQSSLAAGESMTCTSLYLVTAGDLAAGQVEISATVTANLLSAASTQIILKSAAETVSKTFAGLSNNFVADRARVLGNAISLPNILMRRNAGNRPGTIQASSGQDSQMLSFSSSLAEWRNWAASKGADGVALGVLDEPMPLNIWIDAQFSLHAATEGGERWGRIGTVALGADYLVTDDILAGIMVQGDWAAEQSAAGEVSGSGFLVGPYVSVALDDHLSLDATVLYGRSSNTVSASVLGEGLSGSFDTTRLYAKSALTGYFEINQLTVRPNATFVLTSESIGGYGVSNADGDTVAVPGGDHLQYRLTVGGTAEYAIALDGGATLTPIVGLDVGISGNLQNSVNASPSFLGRFKTGFVYDTDFGLLVGLEFGSEFDSGGFSSASVRASIKGRF